MSHVAIAGSIVPGQHHTHVRGPQQAPVDPAAAGLEVLSPSEPEEAVNPARENVPVPVSKDEDGQDDGASPSV